MFGPVEKWLGYLAVVAVLRRINLQRQLADCSHSFLRGNRDAQRSIRTERLPVLRNSPHVLVPKDHRHRLALKIVDEDAVIATGFAKWIRLAVNWAGHGKKILNFQGVT